MANSSHAAGAPDFLNNIKLYRVRLILKVTKIHKHVLMCISLVFYSNYKQKYNNTAKV